MKDVFHNGTQKILNLNFYIFIAAIVLNFLIFTKVINLNFNYLLKNELIVTLVNNSSFPRITSDSLQFTLLISLFLFIINVFLSIFLALYYLSNKENSFFNKIKNNNEILYVLGFRTIYPIEYHKLIDHKSIFFKVVSLLFYILILFNALEWFIWFGVPLVPFWLFKLISNYQFFLFLWNIFLVIAIDFVCPSMIGLSIVLIYSIFRPTSDGACVEQK